MAPAVGVDSCTVISLGTVVWSKAVDAVLPEDPYGGMGIPEHGYASNTPVTDSTWWATLSTAGG